MRHILIAAMMLVVFASTAYAAVKQVRVYKVDYYRCVSASQCYYEFSDEQWEEVDSQAQLVSTDQEVISCSNFPCIKEVRTWYNWAVCYNNICPMSLEREVAF